MCVCVRMRACVCVCVCVQHTVCLSADTGCQIPLRHVSLNVSLNDYSLSQCSEEMSLSDDDEEPPMAIALGTD